MPLPFQNAVNKNKCLAWRSLRKPACCSMLARTSDSDVA